jgi:hypothetical protein
MDRTLEAEMEAARAAARRNRTLRDILLGLEDGARHVSISTGDGAFHAGVVTAVGADHVEIEASGFLRSISLVQIVSIEPAR